MLADIIALFLSFLTMLVVTVLWGACVVSKHNKTGYAYFAFIGKAVLIIMYCAISHFKPYL